MNPTNGNEVDYDQLLTEKVKEVLAAEKGNASGNNQENPYSFSINGQTFNYENKAAFESAMQQFVSKTASQLATLQQQVATTQDNRGSFVSGNDEQDAPQWSDEQYVELFQKSPKLAFEYALNQTVFGGKSDNAVGDLRQAIEDSENVKKAIAAFQFRQTHPEFQGSQEVGAVLEKIHESMNLPYDSNGLEAAYLVGINKGLIPNFYAQQQNQQQQFQGTQQAQQVPQLTLPGQQIDPRQWNGGFGQQGQNNPYMQAPPGVGRSNTSNVNTPNFEDLSLPQLAEALKKMGIDVS